MGITSDSRAELETAVFTSYHLCRPSSSCNPMVFRSLIAVIHQFFIWRRGASSLPRSGRRRSTRTHPREAGSRPAAAKLDGWTKNDGTWRMRIERCPRNPCRGRSGNIWRYSSIGQSLRLIIAGCGFEPRCRHQFLEA